AIGPEVKEENRGAVFDLREWRTTSVDDYEWLKKLISSSIQIRFSDRSYRIRYLFPDCMHEQIVSPFGSLPTLVAIHCVVTTHNRSNATNTDLIKFSLERCDVISAGTGRRVASVEKTMDENTIEIVIPGHL